MTPAEVAADLCERIGRQRDRRVARDCLRLMRGCASWHAPAYEPTEAELVDFIERMHANPQLVPSGDPDDP